MHFSQSETTSRVGNSGPLRMQRIESSKTYAISNIAPSLRVRNDAKPRLHPNETVAKWRFRPDWSSSAVDEAGYLSEAAVARYRALFLKIDGLSAGDEVDIGAVETARRILAGMLLAKWSPPQMTWHGGDAVVFFWKFGETVHAFTVTEGELGYLERRGKITARRRDSIPADENCFLCVL